MRFDGFEGYGPSDTRSSDDITLDRRLNVRWQRVNSDYGGTSGSSRIWNGSARGDKLCWDFRTRNGHSWVSWLKDELSTIIMGFGLFPWNGQSGDIIYFRHDSGNNMVLGITSNSEIYIKRDNGTRVATSGPLIKWRRWNYIEVKATFDATAGAVELRLNGKTIINLTGQDFQATAGHPHSNNISWWYHDYQKLDDIYIIDPNTSGLDDFLGPIVVRRLKPSADSATADFTPSTGTSHFACVDNDRADATDYLESSTVNDDELWDYENVPSEIASIKAINIETSFAATGAEAKTAASLCKSGTTAVQEVGQRATVETDWDQFNDIMETDPDTGSAWTISGLNAAQFGVRHKA
jgi:hypothetical protein